ncbi:Pyridoxamine 5'-phosphate oxidase [Planctomycetes bacterium Pan216]|uniref:Pyridoxamine 5'-phosphate oxidase n=1 Tax=Kolteria novifilia TaxID=2527975 RepID=A0A518B0W4_9BACT|nr:Pyridoxamine 5'-phosphate oxidase [Planctomycetes bacterium Pan216]
MVDLRRLRIPVTVSLPEQSDCVLKELGSAAHDHRVAAVERAEKGGTVGEPEGALSSELREFLSRQKIFFTASVSGDGELNLSPKQADAFRVLGEDLVGYLDLPGRRAETSRHLRERRRMVIMFCSFEEDPLIVRLFGRGQVVTRDDLEWESTRSQFDQEANDCRGIILLRVEHVQRSRGARVPMFDYRGLRTSRASDAETSDRGV